MKKLIIACLLAIVLVPSSASAQTVTNEDLQKLINDLMAQVVVLMQKLIEVQTQSGQVLGTTVSAAPTSYEPEIILGTPYCANAGRLAAYVPIKVFGDNWTYALVTVSSSNTSAYKNTKLGGKFMRSAPLEQQRALVPNMWGETTFKIELGTQPKTPTSDEPLTEFTVTKKMFIGDVCQ